MEGEDSRRHCSWADLAELTVADERSSRYGVAEEDVDLWLIHLQVPAETLERCASLLSADEIARAGRFRFQQLRDHFTVARGAARLILGSYLGMSPEAIQFHYAAYGKPSLSPDLNPEGVTFNLSHSRHLAMLAIGKNRRMGIDLEYREKKRDLEQIAARNFTAQEAGTILSLAVEDRTNAFYACWTLKEAYIKAIGDGLSTPLDSFEVRFPPSARASLASVGSSRDEHLRWQAYGFTVEEHAAALIVEGQRPSIRRAVWNSQMR